MKLKKNVRILKLLGTISLIAGSLALNSCVDPNYGGPQSGQGANRGGQAFKQALIGAIARADRIVIEEHSHQSDFIGLLSDTNNAPRYKYGNSELTGAERTALLNDVRRMDPTASSGPSQCSMSPHYTIDFYEQGWLSSKLRVSYKCRTVSWNGSNSVVPVNVLNAISPTIARAGFTANKNWKAQAASRYSPPTTTPKPNSKPNSPAKPSGPPTAKKIPGKPGHVYNPFNQNEVDVEGIPSGTKVRDPHDPNEAHIFRVP